MKVRRQTTLVDQFYLQWLKERNIAAVVADDDEDNNGDNDDLKERKKSGRFFKTN